MSRINHANAFEASIAGIPCLIEIEHYLDVPPNPNCWDSADDYYGYTEIEWKVYDRKGYPAAWLERKINDVIRDEIDTKAIETVKEWNFVEPDFDYVFDDCPY